MHENLLMQQQCLTKLIQHVGIYQTLASPTLLHMPGKQVIVSVSLITLYHLIDYPQDALRHL